jgi:heme-degrading monooxygenase HmoA
MRQHTAKLIVPSLLFAGLGFACPGSATAQQTGGETPPPKIVQIIAETLKPGRAGSPHVKTESAFVQAFASAKWPEHYLGMDSLSGKSRSLFFVGYDSFESWQKDVDAAQKNSSLSAALDSANIADGDLLESSETSAYAFREDLSLRAPVKIEDMRYMEITLFRVKPGHEKDFEDMAKIYVKAYEKIPGVHWAAFKKVYGIESGSRYIIVSPMKSMAEVDQEMKDDKTFAAATSPDQLQKLSEMTALSMESSETSLFAINPKMSYVADSWIKANPAFWSPK